MKPTQRTIDRVVERILEAVVRAQTTHPLRVLAVGLVTVVLAVVMAAQLTLKTSFGELLPQNKESVVVAARVQERLVSASTLAIVAHGEDKAALQRFVDTLAPELRKLDPELVGAVDDGVRASREFFQNNRLLYAPLSEVEKAHADIIERYDWEVAKQAGTLLDESDPPPPVTAESIKQRLEGTQKKPEAKSNEPTYPDGYYMEPDGRMAVVLVRTSVSTGDLSRHHSFLDMIQGVIDRVDPKSFDPTMRINFTGDFITAAEEYRQIKDDLADVGVRGVLMILAVVFLFYLRLRPLFLMSLTVGIGTLWTFGLARLLVGHLNSSTGFLVSIVVGNGINFGIIFMARYMEARRDADMPKSLRIAYADTWLSTLSAAGSAMVAYGSLVVTDFRGFKHFGVIGGSGMILTWIATYAFLPAMLVVSERIRPIPPERGVVSRLRAGYGRPFAALAMRWPRAVLVVGVLSGLGAMTLAIRYIAKDPMEYDLSNTRNQPTQVESNARLLMRRVDKVVGRLGQDGVAIMVDRTEQVEPLKAELEKRRDAAPATDKPFQKVVTIFDLLPKDQEKKIELYREARDRLERAHRRKLINEDDWAKLVKELPPKDVRPLGMADLPEQVARSFVEKDGTRGRLVYIVPTSGKSVWDAHYLLKWADSFRSTPLPDGSVVKGSGRSVIFADMVLAVHEDAPKAILVSLTATLGILLLTFRARGASFASIATLALGLSWMMSVLALRGAKVGWAGGLPTIELVGMKLNFLNFVALPISIGIGADYAVHVMQRYRLEGAGSAGRVIRETGGAVILCSLTTVLGYFALTSSVNKAIQSFGIAALSGEIGCLLAAVLVLPAALEWRDRRARARQAAGGAPPASTPPGDGPAEQTPSGGEAPGVAAAPVGVAVAAPASASDGPGTADGHDGPGGHDDRGESVRDVSDRA